MRIRMREFPGTSFLLFLCLLVYRARCRLGNQNRHSSILRGFVQYGLPCGFKLRSTPLSTSLVGQLRSFALRLKSSIIESGLKRIADTGTRRVLPATHSGRFIFLSNSLKRGSSRSFEYATSSFTDIIWKGATIRGFTFRLFAADTIAGANKAILGYLIEGALKPKIGKVFPLTEAAEAVRYLIEGRPYGRVVMRVPPAGRAA